MQTNRGEGQCSLLEVFGEKKYLQFVSEKQMKRLNHKRNFHSNSNSLVITPKTQICYKPSGRGVTRSEKGQPSHTASQVKRLAFFVLVVNNK